MPGPFRFLGRFSIQCVWGPRGFADPFPPPYSDTLIAHAHTHTHMYSLQHTGNIAQINFAEGFQSRLHVLNNDYGYSNSTHTHTHSVYTLLQPQQWRMRVVLCRRS